MKYLQINEQPLGQQDYNLVEKVNEDINVYAKSPYPSEGVFLLDKNANVLGKDVDSYPAGTIKAYGFKAGDGNYYAVDAEAIPDRQYWGGYGKFIDSLPAIPLKSEAEEDYNGEHNTDEIIKALADYNDGYTTGAPAAEVCRARQFNGRKGFLPTLGQFNDFFSHKSEVDSLATKFSLDAFPTDSDHWTSTLYSEYDSWVLHWSGGYISYDNRNYQMRVRAFFAL